MPSPVRLLPRPAPLSALPFDLLHSSCHTHLWTSCDVERRDVRAENGYCFYNVIWQLATVGDIQVFQEQRGLTVGLEEISKVKGQLGASAAPKAMIEANVTRSLDCFPFNPWTQLYPWRLESRIHPWSRCTQTAFQMQMFFSSCQNNWRGGAVPPKKPSSLNKNTKTCGVISVSYTWK